MRKAGEMEDAGAGNMQKLLPELICNGLLLSNRGMIHSAYSAGKSSSCRNSLQQAV